MWGDRAQSKADVPAKQTEGRGIGNLNDNLCIQYVY